MFLQLESLRAHAFQGTTCMLHALQRYIYMFLMDDLGRPTFLQTCISIPHGQD